MPVKKVVEYLLSFSDFDLNNTAKDGATALSVCASHEPDFCPLLLDKGADPNQLTRSGRPPLFNYLYFHCGRGNNRNSKIVKAFLRDFDMNLID